MAFDWANLSAPVTKGLAAAAGLDVSTAHASLRREYGKTPDVRFIEELWTPLREQWLTRDRPSASEVATRLRARGAGRQELPARNHEQRLAYLRSCRLSAAVREEALAVFLIAGGGSAQKARPDKPAGAKAAPKSPTAAKATARKVADRGTPKDPVTESAAAAQTVVEEMRPGLAAMSDTHVPGVVTALHAYILGNTKDSASEQEYFASMFLATVHVLSQHTTLVPAGLDHTAVEAIGMPAEVASAARSVAKGARSWARVGPNDLGYLIGQHFSQPTRPDVDHSVSMILHFLVTGGDPRVGSDAVLLRRLYEWSLALMSRPREEEPDQPAPSAPRGLVNAQKAGSKGSTKLHPVVATALSSAGEDEMVQPITNGGMWFASSVGGTRVWSNDPVRSRDHVVTAVRVETSFQPRRVPPARQLAAALSYANVHNGVNSVCWANGKVHIRTAMGAYPAINGWLGPFVGVAMMSSAMFALHAAPELRGDPVAGAQGVRRQPSHFVAELGGFEVGQDDQAHFPLPSRDLLRRSAASTLAGFGEVKKTKDTVECRLPGPNGRLEGWLGRRGNRSDDQFLTISAVTRPPWGAGVKFVLTIPNNGTKYANEDLAMRWNALEWEQVPTVNVWGGWSGEDGALRLTSFVPQMLCRPSEESNAAMIGNFIMYVVGRGNTASVSLNLA